MNFLLRCYYSSVAFTMILDAIAKSENCKWIRKKCQDSNQCCDEIACVKNRCCKNLGDKCKRNKDCCFKNYSNKICSCPKMNKNFELNNGRITACIRNMKKEHSNIEYWNVKKVTDMSNLFNHENIINSTEI